MTDDMKMDAIQLQQGEAAVQTVLAGSDIVLSTSKSSNARSIKKALCEVWCRMLLQALTIEWHSCGPKGCLRVCIRT